MSDFWIQDGERMLFIGDSITDCGRRDRAIPLGDGYVSIFAELATARYPERNIEWVNTGIGGNRTTHLRERWQPDVIDHRPDRLSIKIGINDLHSVLRRDPDAVPPDRYRRNLDEILTSTRQALGDIPVILITPFYISTNMDDEVQGTVLRMILQYIDVVEDMSAKYDTLLLNLHDVFQEQLRYRSPSTFCPEPVHPNHTGHLVIADALMEVLSR
jgi:lysophospholipase L1-like esterase